MQTKIGSLIEASCNTFIGLMIASTLNYFIMPFFYSGVTVEKSVYISIIYTVFSVLRSYIVRRFFNKKEKSNVV